MIKLPEMTSNDFELLLTALEDAARWNREHDFNDHAERMNKLQFKLQNTFEEK